MPTLTELKKDIADYIRLRLGDQMVDVELDPEHLEMGIKQALIRYRQRAQNSAEESYAFLELVKEQTEYIMPPEIISVRQVFRRGIGSVTGTTASQFEPFASGYLNTYMLVAGRVGGLTNYELFTQYQELAMKMFGGHINFTFDPVSRKLTIMRKIPENGESVLLWVYNTRPDHAILSSYQSFPWIQDYAYALAKYSLGEAREKFGNVPGPQGGTTLNGTALKTEARELMDKLDEDLKNYLDGSSPLGFVVG
jgi:hypothetical protein